MNDRHGKRALADDPIFLASLDDLDRGLAGGDDDSLDDPLEDDAFDEPVEIEPPSVVAQPRPRTARAPIVQRRREVAPNDVPVRQTPPFAARRASLHMDVDRPAPEPVRPAGRRPLLDLFPPSPNATEPTVAPLAGERPPGPIVGSAIGPRLARTPARREALPPQPVDPPTYEMFYGLAEKPFGVSTDPKFFYQSTAHECAVVELATAIRERRGVALLTGELGLGKTTVCRATVADFDRRTVTSLLLEPLLSVDELLKTVLVDFGVISLDDLSRAPEVTRDVLLATLRSFLDSLAPLQANAVIIVDEAQNLPADLLSDLLGVVDAGRESGVLQVVLVGQPAISELLRRPELRPLAASIAAVTALGPLSADEILGYVTHRLAVAGSTGRVEFPDGACARLYELSRGVPRVVNLLCDRALSRGHQTSASVIDAALIDAAAEDLDLGTPPREPLGIGRRLAIALAVEALLFAGAAAALWVFQDAVARTIERWENVPAAPGAPIRRLPLPLTPIPPPALPTGSGLP